MCKEAEGLGRMRVENMRRNSDLLINEMSKFCRETVFYCGDISLKDEV